jgi:hypothetical protein
MDESAFRQPPGVQDVSERTILLPTVTEAADGAAGVAFYLD